MVFLYKIFKDPIVVRYHIMFYKLSKTMINHFLLLYAKLVWVFINIFSRLTRLWWGTFILYTDGLTVCSLHFGLIKFLSVLGSAVLRPLFCFTYINRIMNELKMYLSIMSDDYISAWKYRLHRICWTARFCVIWSRLKPFASINFPINLTWFHKIFNAFMPFHTFSTSILMFSQESPIMITFYQIYLLNMAWSLFQNRIFLSQNYRVLGRYNRGNII